jgi:hypothetical protein
VTIDQPFGELYVSEPMSLPTVDAPVLVLANVNNPQQLNPDPLLGSASVTLPLGLPSVRRCCGRLGGGPGHDTQRGRHLRPPSGPPRDAE